MFLNVFCGFSAEVSPSASATRKCALSSNSYMFLKFTLWVQWGGIALCLASAHDAAQLTHPRLRIHTQIFCQVSK
jgi:hypothetical protein